MLLPSGERKDIGDRVAIVGPHARGIDERPPVANAAHVMNQMVDRDPLAVVVQLGHVLTNVVGQRDASLLDEERDRGRRARSSWTRSTCRTARSPRSGTSLRSSASGGACMSTRRPTTASRRSAIRCSISCTARSTATIRGRRVGRAADILDNLIARGQSRADDRRDARGSPRAVHAGRRAVAELDGSCASSTATSGRTSRSTTRRERDRSRRRSRGSRWAVRRRSRSRCGISRTSATSACSARAC